MLFRRYRTSVGGGFMSSTFQDRKNASPDYCMFCILAEKRFTNTFQRNFLFKHKLYCQHGCEEDQELLEPNLLWEPHLTKRCVPGSEITNLWPISPRFEWWLRFFPFQNYWRHSCRSQQNNVSKYLETACYWRFSWPGTHLFVICYCTLFWGIFKW